MPCCGRTDQSVSSLYTMVLEYDVSAIERQMREKAHEILASGDVQDITINCKTPWGCSVSYDSKGDAKTPAQIVKARQEEDAKFDIEMKKYSKMPTPKRSGFARPGLF